jgi:hypothetical protein
LIINDLLDLDKVLEKQKQGLLLTKNSKITMIDWGKRRLISRKTTRTFEEKD